MSIEDDSDQPARASVPQIVAHLVVLGQQHGLPDPDHLYAAASNGIAGLKFDSREQLDAWYAALGGRVGDVSSQRYRDGYLHSGYVRGVRGWAINLSAETAGAGATAPVEPAMVAALEALAGAR